jgi:hypothetical protein
MHESNLNTEFLPKNTTACPLANGGDDFGEVNSDCGSNNSFISNVSSRSSLLGSNRSFGG